MNRFLPRRLLFLLTLLSGLGLGQAIALSQVSPTTPAPAQPTASSIERLQHPVATVRLEAICALTRQLQHEPAPPSLGPLTAAQQQHVAILVQQLGSPSWRKRQAAAHELRQFGLLVSDALKAAAESPDLETAVRAEELFAAIYHARLPQEGKDAPAVALSRLLWDPEVRVRRAAALSLAQLGPRAREAVPHLLQAAIQLEYDDYTQIVAARALSRTGSLGLQALLVALGSDDPDERTRAAWRLGEAGALAKGAVPALAERLQDREVTVRRAAFAALEQIGPAARAAVPSLRAALQKDDGSASLAAAAALWRIEHQADAELLQVLADALKGTRATDPWQAASVLGQMGPPARPILLAALRDSNSLTRQAATHGLAALRPTEESVVTGLLEAMRRETYQHGLTDFIRALGQIGPPAGKAAPDLRLALRSPDQAVREAAVQALGKITPEDPLTWEALTAALGDPDSRVALAAVAALADLGPSARSAAPALTKLLNGLERQLQGGKSPFVREPSNMTKSGKGDHRRVEEYKLRVLAALWAVERKAETVVPALKTVLRGPRNQACVRAAALLWEVTREPKEVVPILSQLLQEPSWSIRESAMQALCKIEPLPGEMQPTLADALFDDNPIVREWAMEGLGRIRPVASSTVPVLERALHDPHFRVRYRAAQALAFLKSDARAAVPGLREALKDNHVWVRRQAAAALWIIGQETEANLPVLQDVLREEEATERQQAARILGTMGPAARTAIPALTKALEDPVPQVRLEAAAALWHIRQFGVHRGTRGEAKHAHGAGSQNVRQSSWQMVECQVRYWKDGWYVATIA